jgi:hypothetical protein
VVTGQSTGLHSARYPGYVAPSLAMAAFPGGQLTDASPKEGGEECGRTNGTASRSCQETLGLMLLLMRMRILVLGLGC